MTAAKNTIIRSVNPGSVFESAIKQINSTVSFNQGDILVWDDTNKVLKVPTAESEHSTFLGIARCTIVSGKLASPYSGTAVDAAAAISDIPGPLYGIVAQATLKGGDSLTAGQLVYGRPEEGTRCVQSTGTKAIGVYQGPAVTGGPSTSPTVVEVLFGHRYPADTLSF